MATANGIHAARTLCVSKAHFTEDWPRERKDRELQAVQFPLEHYVSLFFNQSLSRLVIYVVSRKVGHSESMECTSAHIHPKKLLGSIGRNPKFGRRPTCDRK